MISETQKELKEFKSKHDFFVGIDSVVSHIAFSLNKPSLVLYCELFKYFSKPINPKVNHILFSKSDDNLNLINLEDVNKQFNKLIQIN